MQQSDAMLVNTLQQYIKVDNHLQSLRDFKGQDIFNISIAVLSYLKIDVSEIQALSLKSQRFRSMAKLNQCLQLHFQTQFQMNDLMNPNIPFVRKFLLSVINKIGSVQDKQRQNKKQVPKQKKKVNKNLLNWVQAEWIHPSLAQPKKKYKGYQLPITINKSILKNNSDLGTQLNNKKLQGNNIAILVNSLSKHDQLVKQFEKNQGISRRQAEQAQIRFANMIKINKDQWQISSNKLTKLKKRLAELIPQQQQVNSQIIVQSVFRQQLQTIHSQNKNKKQQQKQQQTKDTITQTSEQLNPLQKLKREGQIKKHNNEQIIRQMLNQLKLKKQMIQNWQKNKQQIQKKVAQDQQKLIKVQENTVQLKKKVQKRQTVLSTLDGQKDVQQQVSKLQQQIQMIQNQAKQQIDKLQTQIKQLQQESKQKLQALGDLKAKLARVQNDYSRICQQIDQKQQLKKGVKIVKSNISRLYYHKKISQMENRWRQTAKQTKKLKASLTEYRTKVKTTQSLTNTLQKQIINILSYSDKGKVQIQSKQLKQTFIRCKQSFQNTMQILEQVNVVKCQMQQYQIKVHTLSGKNYKQNIQKILLAIQDLKKQLNEASRQSKR